MPRLVQALMSSRKTAAKSKLWKWRKTRVELQCDMSRSKVNFVETGFALDMTKAAKRNYVSPHGTAVSEVTNRELARNSWMVSHQQESSTEVHNNAIGSKSSSELANQKWSSVQFEEGKPVDPDFVDGVRNDEHKRLKDTSLTDEGAVKLLSDGDIQTESSKPDNTLQPVNSDSQRTAAEGLAREQEPTSPSEASPSLSRDASKIDPTRISAVAREDRSDKHESRTEDVSDTTSSEPSSALQSNSTRESSHSGQGSTTTASH